MIRAGTMRNLVEIQEMQTSKDGSGSNVITWVKIADARASINPVTGNEMFMNAQLQNVVTHKIGMRYRALSPKNRIVFNGRIFDFIHALDFQEKKVNLIILAKEVFTDG